MKRSFQNLHAVSEVRNDNALSTNGGLAASATTAAASHDYLERAWKHRVLCRTVQSAIQVKATFLSNASHLAFSQTSPLTCPRKCDQLETALKEEALLCYLLSFLTVREHQFIRQTNRSWQCRVQTLDLDRLDLSFLTSPVCTHTLDRVCQSVLTTYCRVRRLDLSGQRLLLDRDLLVLTSCFWSHMEEIVADDCQEISDVGVLAILNAQSLRLRSVSVRRCKRVTGEVFGAHFSPLQQLTGSHPSLTTLNFDDTSVTQAFISRVEDHFPTLRHLSALHTPAHRTFFQLNPALTPLLRELQLLVSNEVVDSPLLTTVLDKFAQWCCRRREREARVFERTLIASGPRALLDLPLLLTGHGAVIDDTGESLAFVSPLLYACALGKTRLLSLILAVGRNHTAFDVENTDADGHTPLSLAAANGLTEATRLLMRAGGNVNTRSLSLATPLYQASEHGWDTLVDMLLDTNVRRNCTTVGGAIALCAAAKNGHRSIVLRLLAADRQAEGDSQVRNFDRKQQLIQALFLACEGGHLIVVSDLLLLTELDANVLMNENVSPLYLACQMGYQDIVSLLLERGADPTFRRPQGGVSCLYIAAQEGHSQIVQMLVHAGADVHIKMNDLSTALHIAARMGRKAVLQTLLCFGARLNDQTRSGLTALYIASEEGHVEVVQNLLDAGAARDVQTVSGATALFVAVHRNHTSVVEMLLLCGANATVAKFTGASPLDAAVIVGNARIAQLLLRYGARVRGSVLHFAERRRNADNLHALLQTSYSAQQLLDGSSAIQTSIRLSTAAMSASKAPEDCNRI